MKHRLQQMVGMFAFLCFGLLVCHCGSSQKSDWCTDQPDAGSSQCNKQWSTEAEGDLTLKTEVKCGALVLEGTPGSSQSSNKGRVFKDGVSGDFDVNVAFEDFSASNVISQGGIFVSDSASDGIAQVYLLWANGKRPNLDCYYKYQSQNYTQMGAASSFSGTLKIQRAGDQLIMRGKTSDGTESTLTRTFSTAPLKLGMYVENDAEETKPVLIRFTDFSISGGGGVVQSDSFDCNSVNE